MLADWIADNYGSKTGLLRYCRFNAKALFGAYKTNSGSSQPFKRLVFLCSGNICRSPYGEVVARSLGVDTISFGLHCRGGDPANERAVAYAAKRGLDLSGHRSQHISLYEPQCGDLMLVMEPSHLVHLQALNLGVETHFIGSFVKPSTVYLHDPYNTNDIFFEHCLGIIHDAVENLNRMNRE